MVWGFDIVQKFVVKFPAQSESFQSNAQKFPSADKFYSSCYGQGKVGEKRKIFKVKEKSGNSVFQRNAPGLAIGL